MKLNFAENIKSLRKAKGITQEKLAEDLGVSGQSVSRWELSICYPDLEMLPSIANYFGVSVDSLLCNDSSSKEKDRELFYQKLNMLSCQTTERINFVMEYCRKYPENDEYSFQLVFAIKLYACGDKKKTEKYMSILLKNVERLLETQFRYSAIQLMATLCDENELDKWLDLAPYSGLSRRYCLIARAMNHNENENYYIQQGLEMIETLANQLDSRCPDSFGAEIKEIYQQEVLQTVASFGKEGEVPDGWKLFYAYKQLVLAACLFAQGKTDKGWSEFDSAMEKCRYIFSLDREWLSIGGLLFSNLKVDKAWNYAIDEHGNKHELFAVSRLSFYNIEIIYSLLTDPCWAWFNSVRETKEYQGAVAWVKEIKENQKT